MHFKSPSHINVVSFVNSTDAVNWAAVCFGARTNIKMLHIVENQLSVRPGPTGGGKGLFPHAAHAIPSYGRPLASKILIPWLI